MADWSFDPSHTHVEFSAKHMMVSTVKGHFAKVTGEVDIDEEHLENSHVNVEIDAASIDTGFAQRDGHLRSPDFLDVEHYPTITFKSTHVEKLGEEHGRITGDLTIRGVTREVTLETSFEGEANDMQGKRHAGFTAATAISRKDWGLQWNVALESGGWLVGDTVKIAIDTELVQQAPATVAATTGAQTARD
jgi:polyisoprenoid-binding protein YceI